MKTNDQFKAVRRILSEVIVSAIFVGVLGTGNLPIAHAQVLAGNLPSQTMSQTSTSESVGGYVLSDGQFVYGPNIGNFNVKTYLEANAPHLSNYADALYGRSEYYSINPKIYLTFLEIHSHMISAPEPALMDNSLGLNNGDLIAQIEVLSEKMSEAYYLHLYAYSQLPVSQRTLKPFVTPSGVTISVAPDTNAGSYAIIAGLAAMDEQNISLMLDISQANGFYQTYRRLFASDAGDDPLDETNHISIPGAIPDNFLQLPDAVIGAAAPDKLLQLPFLRGLSWKFGGVHNTGGAHDFTDASSLDFYPSGSTWGMDTSTMWVVAAASGIPTRYSDCGFKISHSGLVNSGWETTYYHLEGAKYLSGSINQNDKIGVIANTLAEATCTGGSATGPHVHFSLKYNGAYVAINGTPLSGWYVHSGRYSYDVDRNYMWLERAGVKKYAYGDLVLSEGIPVVINGNIGVAGEIVEYTGGSTTTDSNGNYSITILSGWTGTVAPSSLCYTYTPQSLSYTNISSDQAVQNFIPSTPNPGCLDVTIGNDSMGSYFLAPGAEKRLYYPVSGGPVKVASQDATKIIAAIRLQSMTPTGTLYSFVETMGVPKELVSDKYYFPTYNNTWAPLNSQVRFANLGISPTDIRVTIGGNIMDTYTVPAQGERREYYNVSGGPVIVESLDGTKIIAAIRLQSMDASGTLYSFAETMGVPFEILSDTYYFPTYNNTWAPLNSQVRFANLGTSPTDIRVTIGGTEVGTYTVPAQGEIRDYYNISGGPVKVESLDGTKIIAAIRLQSMDASGRLYSFVETMGVPKELVTDKYYFPTYNNTWVPLNSQVRFANLGSSPTDIRVTIGGTVMHTYTNVPAQGEIRDYYNVSGGPVIVESLDGTKITAAIRLQSVDASGILYSFAETMGVPKQLLSDTYYLPTYNNTWAPLNSQVRFGVP